MQRRCQGTVYFSTSLHGCPGTAYGSPLVHFVNMCYNISSFPSSLHFLILHTERHALRSKQTMCVISPQYTAPGRAYDLKDKTLEVLSST